MSLCWLFQRHQNAPVFGQRCAGLSLRSADWNHKFTPDPWRTSSPLCPRFGFRYTQALAAIYDGATRTEAAKIGGVDLQIIRDWVLRFNARGPDGLLNGKAPGQPCKLNDTQRQSIARMIESGPIPAIHGVVR